ncbi:MAG: hypothetical protein LBK76_10840 [Verrucomicrobiales bacterium]|jgi:hypothetical protein|nr:hypothetical protein [Verrucomicrobiales bacterium]
MASSTSPLAAALALLDRQGLLPTSLKSAELREKLSARVRGLAVFSARQDNAEYLQEVKDVTGKVLTGEMSSAEARTILGDKLAALRVPAADGDELTDHTSVSRRDLVVQTRVDILRGYGNQVAAQDENALWAAPAQELYRLFATGKQRDWEQRWQDAGGEFFDGRMIAKINDPVWQNLGTGAGGYADTLGNPYPPFAFNSGMDVREVPRYEAEELGVIGRGEEIAAADVDLPEFEAGVGALDGELQRALAADGELEVRDGVLGLRNRANSKRQVSNKTQISMFKNRIALALRICNRARRLQAEGLLS